MGLEVISPCKALLCLRSLWSFSHFGWWDRRKVGYEQETNGFDHIDCGCDREQHDGLCVGADSVDAECPYPDAYQDAASYVHCDTAPHTDVYSYGCAASTYGYSHDNAYFHAAADGYSDGDRYTTSARTNGHSDAGATDRHAEALVALERWEYGLLAK